ncbi:OmpA/MotB family protein [Sphingobium nicotianae]|uniref:Flagellar motor protein n=1 Tax=Sphingobium nicotianae TaxID=2782607 RepID=A0A9X1DCB7_9SPHN|nr:flagellar motor protein MotB [Sphingobium nicotianae]MBT2187068.1 flagellar motor protein [Sphingobium nicotianae]
MSRAIPRANRGRWALSFADLCLLLLGFFVLLQANQVQRDRALAGIGSYFGAIEAPAQADLQARSLFEPGEAFLSMQGKIVLLKAAKPFATSKEIIQIQSIGVDGGNHRFDAWDLAAARLGAVARALVAAGIPQQRLRIAGLAEDADGRAPGRQIIRIVEKPLAQPQ